MDTWIEIRCAAKPGSTVNTLELLGLEIQYCVISCFNDFSMQAFFLFFFIFIRMYADQICGLYIYFTCFKSSDSFDFSICFSWYLAR